MRKGLQRLWSEDEGQNLTEYALLLIMLCMISIAAMSGFASSVSSMYSRTSGRVVTATVQGSGALSRAGFSSGSPSGQTTLQEKNFDDGVLNTDIAVQSRSR